MMWFNRSAYRCVAVALALVVGGCASSGTPRTEAPPAVAPPPQTTPAPPVPAPQPPARPPQPSTSGAWQPLLNRASEAAARGDYEQALTLLERAQRIEPSSGAIYLQMARVHKARGDGAQSRSTAERGLLYCNSSAECEALRAFTR